MADEEAGAQPSEKGGKGKGALNRLMSDAWKGGLSEKGKSQGKDKGQKGKGSAKGSGPPWVKNVPILLNDQLHHQLLQGFHKACSPRLPGSNPRLPFERFHPRGKPKRCMLWSRPLLPMLFCSFLLQESHLVSLCPLEHSSSMLRGRRGLGRACSKFVISPRTSVTSKMASLSFQSLSWTRE